MQPANPYEAPRAIGRRSAEGWVVCPRCGSDDVAMPTFTWWGGLAGQKLLSHVKCNGCTHTYNGKTGESNTAKIVVYQVVAVLLVVGLFLLTIR